jgi:Zn finger protein HypA/HybF involved in hydrogenase expression
MSNAEEKLMLNEKQLSIYNETRSWIEGLSGEILDLVKDYDHVMMGNKTVVCTAILKTGFEITAFSAPIDPKDFNLELGRVLAKRKVLEELLTLERYHKFNMKSPVRSGIGTMILSNGVAYEAVDEYEERPVSRREVQCPKCFSKFIRVIENYDDVYNCNCGHRMTDAEDYNMRGKI